MHKSTELAFSKFVNRQFLVTDLFRKQISQTILIEIMLHEEVLDQKRKSDLSNLIKISQNQA